MIVNLKPYKFLDYVKVNAPISSFRLLHNPSIVSILKMRKSPMRFGTAWKSCGKIPAFRSVKKEASYST